MNIKKKFSEINLKLNRASAIQKTITFWHATLVVNMDLILK